MGGAILEILGKYKIQKFQKGYSGGMISVVSDHGRDVKFTRHSPLSAVNQS